MKFVIIAILLLFTVIWLRSRNSQAAPRTASRAKLKKKLQEKQDASTARSRSPYQAVSIHYGAQGCPAVESIGNRRFLVTEAPVTPLVDCSSPYCNCKYLRHEDRRHEDGDRRAVSLGDAGLYSLSGRPEQRKSIGRREKDLEDYAAA